MNQSLVSVLTSLKPAIYMAASIPCLIALIMWLIFYVRYDMGQLKAIKKAFQSLSDKGEKFEGCKRENISFLDESAISIAPPYFLEAWQRMLMQLDKNFKGDFIPEGQSFYKFDAMITNPGCRSRLDSLWKSFWVLSIMTLVLPVGTAFFIQSMAVYHALAIGVVFFLLLCLGNLFFTMLDEKIYFSTKMEYARFIATFDRLLPVAKAEVALLLEATQRNGEMYQAATDKISDKFDTIVEDALLPALEGSIELIMLDNLIPALRNIEKLLDTSLKMSLELQEQGMERMTAAFADRLGDTVQAKMTGLGDMIGSLTGSIKTVQNRMEELNTDLELHMTELQDAMTSNIAMQDQQAAKTMQLQNERMTQAMELQEQAMERISTSFADSLTNTLDVQMGSLAMTISDVRGQMEEFNFSLGNHIVELMETSEKGIDLQNKQITAFSAELQSLMGELNTRLAANVEDLSGMLEVQRKVMEESADILISTGESQERTIAENKAILQKSVENSEFLNQQIQAMAATIDRLTEQNITFSREAFNFTRETNEAQIRMSEDVKISQGKLEAAVNETMSQYAKMNSMISAMMDDITGRMNEAMTNAGREIAQGIKEVTADNAEAISNLTEQAQNLRSDYDTYFSRLESSTGRLLEDMDYQMKDIIMRITEDIGAMMKENIGANAEILERYKDNTMDLLQSFDEQARSIGLYAKEINMDITELTSSLQTSAGEFSRSMQEGVHATLGEFDTGLSELTERIANTVENITDAIEALPEALGKR